MNKLSPLAAAAALVLMTACGGGSDPWRCYNACPAIGATVCSGAQVETCVAATNGCLVWSAPADCPASQACDATQNRCLAQPYGDVTLYWDFVRYTLDGSTFTYDSSLGNPSSTACTQSGVDFVSVTYTDGSYVDPSTPTIDCVVQGTQGASFTNVQAGTQQFVVTGYRQVGNGSVALYQSTATVNVTAGKNNAAVVDVAGIPGDLELDARFMDASGTTNPWVYCTDANVQTLTYDLVDGAGTTVASGQVSCTDPAGVSFLSANQQAIDLDAYTVRMKAFRDGVATPIFDSSTTAFAPACALQAFNHYGTDVGSAAWIVDLYDVTKNSTLCQ